MLAEKFKRRVFKYLNIYSRIKTYRLHTPLLSWCSICTHIQKGKTTLHVFEMRYELSSYGVLVCFSKPFALWIFVSFL